MVKARGFTLIELLVVMAIIATLLAIAVPRYFGSLERSREAVLRENLRTTREAIDRFYGDLGRYPESLQELVARRYLRSLPFDPVLESSVAWTLRAPPEDAALAGRIYDLKSAAPGQAADGSAFSEW
jgi:general secretion pathway protein G